MSLKNAKQSKNKQEILRILNKKKSGSIEEAQRREITPAPPASEGGRGTSAPAPANWRPTPAPNRSAPEGQNVEKTCRGQKEQRGNETSCRRLQKKEKNKRVDKKPTNSSRRRPRKDAGLKSVSNSRAGSAVKIPRQLVLAQCRTEKLLTRIRKILSMIVKRMNKPDKRGHNDKKMNSLEKKKKRPKKGLSFLTADGQFPRLCSEAVKKIETESLFNDGGDIPWFSPSVKSSVAVSQNRECSIPSDPSFSVKGSDKNYEEEEGAFYLL